MDKSVSSSDILNILDTNIITYDKLVNVENILDILSVNNDLVILFQTKENYGHWVCLFYNPETNILSFFDSYGLMPDSQLKFSKKYLRSVMGYDYFPHLTYLLLKSNIPVEYNEHVYQKRIKDIVTCGRHVLVRLVTKGLNSDEYYLLMKKIRDRTNLSYDEIVTYLTRGLIR